ncbi:LysR substrate-binding domain-containing protein [Mongoliimonas terrestris]|uniref:LysR substrate-binding domain-containing protein n=1 Tax=Mongoliimonas terrestris TaxID=1709001 RepID=UPI000949A13F|nr:LysR substrate-binding domain-containing protein [Mongoliimonas terrestris]
MTRSLPLNALHAFEAAARTGSFRVAGEELGISASAVSHAIRKLEDQIGASLFERDGRVVRLNPGGEVLYRHVSDALDGLRQGIAMVGSRSDKLLRVHCAPSFATQWLMPRLSRFLIEHPGLEVRFSADTNYPRFQNDEFDLDICYGQPRQDGLIVLPLREELVTPLCRPDIAEKVRQPSDLYAFSLIESEHKRVRWPDWFASNGLPAPAPNGNRFDRSFMAITAAVDGMGITLESTQLAERELQRGDLVAPLRESARNITYTGHFVVFPQRVRPRRAVRTFVNWVMGELDLPELTA